MPCSCGNTTCPCGIPCYCLKELCQCHDCAIALHHFCKICNKPLITDIQTDVDTCSCFVGESTALTLENRDNPQCRMGNIPMPVDYFLHGKLIVNVMIPIRVRCFPQFIPQRPISLMFPEPSIQTDSRNIVSPFASDLDIVTPLSPLEDSGTHSTSELHQLLDKSNGHSSNHASSGICSTSAQNAEISFKETCPSLVLQSTEERKTANIVQNSKSETEGSVVVQSPSFYLPSITIGNISYPVGIADPIWRLPNPAFCEAGSPDSSLKICNPLYGAQPVQTRTTFGKECRQSPLNLNFDSNELAQADSVTILQMNEQPLDLTKITGHSDLEIHGERVEFNSSLSTATGNKFTAFSSSGNSNEIPLTEQRRLQAFNTLPSNETSENYLMPDEILAAASTDISSSGVQELPNVQSQPVFSVSTYESGRNGCLQASPVNSMVAETMPTGEAWQRTNFWCPYQIPSEQVIPENFGAPNTSKFQPLFNKSSAQISEEKEYPQSGNSSSVLVNDNRNEEIDSIPLYIDTSTTQKMEKLLKSVKHSSAIAPPFIDVDSTWQN